MYCFHTLVTTLQLSSHRQSVGLFSSSSRSPVWGGWVRAPADRTSSPSWSSASPGSNQDPRSPLCLVMQGTKQRDLPALQILWSKAEDCWYCCIHYQLIAVGQCPGWRLCLLYWHPSNLGKYWIKQERGSAKMSRWSPRNSLWCMTSLPRPKGINTAVENGKNKPLYAFYLYIIRDEIFLPDHTLARQ